MIRSLLAILIAAPALHAAEVRVFAAASLTDALKSVAAMYERTTRDRVVFNFGASNILARQIEEGAPADLFLSADEAQMDRIDKQGLIDRSTRISGLSNTLVVIGDVRSVRDLAGSRVATIALADPSSVPAGVYARAYLMKIGLWRTIAPKVVATENVRGALAAVEAGNADAAIVYKTDALIAKNIRIAVEITRDEGPLISYPFAVLARAESRAAALRFLNFLTSADARNVFRRFGFLTR